MNRSLTYWVRVNEKGFVGGGFTNTVAADYSFIGGGRSNSIVFNNPRYQDSAIGGGFCNTICNSCNFIGGGCNNVICSPFSAILGGSGNTVGAGYDHVGIFGMNITTVCSCAFHVNNLVAQNMAPSPNPAICAPPLAPTGTLYYVLIAGVCQVFVV